jgi:cobalt-zinc-cadmium efflux system protein
MQKIMTYLSNLKIDRIKSLPNRVIQNWLTVPHLCLWCDQSDSTSRLSYRQWVRFVPIAMSVFALGEWWVGDCYHSLSLLADAGHLWFDALAIWMSLAATYITYNPLFRKLSWLYDGADAIAALANGVGMLVLTIIVLDRAIAGLSLPQLDMFHLSMPLMTMGGLGINCGALILLHPDRHRDLNLHGLWLHALTDTASSAGAMLAAISTGLCHWNWIDLVVSFSISGLTIWCAIPLILTSWQTLGSISNRANGTPSLNLKVQILTAKTYNLQQLIDPHVGDLTQQCLANTPANSDDFSLSKY